MTGSNVTYALSGGVRETGDADESLNRSVSATRSLSFVKSTERLTLDRANRLSTADGRTFSLLLPAARASTSPTVRRGSSGGGTKMMKGEEMLTIFLAFVRAQSSRASGRSRSLVHIGDCNRFCGKMCARSRRSERERERGYYAGFRTNETCGTCLRCLERVPTFGSLPSFLSRRSPSTKPLLNRAYSLFKSPDYDMNGSDPNAIRGQDQLVATASPTSTSSATTEQLEENMQAPARDREDDEEDAAASAPLLGVYGSQELLSPEVAASPSGSGDMSHKRLLKGFCAYSVAGEVRRPP